MMMLMPRRDASYLLRVSLSLTICLSLSWARSNLDASEPIVRFSPASEDEDDFGLAVVLHQVEEPVAGDFDSFIDSTRLIVGAPKGTYPGGLEGLPELRPENRTGLIYQCPIRAPGDCGGLLSASSDPENDDRRLFDGDPNGLVSSQNDPEIKGDQLMGSVLASSGDLFLACAPRWVVDPTVGSEFDRRRPVGRCFFSPRNLQNFSAIQACNARLQTNPGVPSCYTGFSASIFDTSTTSAVVLSSLGDNGFNGILYYYNTSTDPALQITRTTSAANGGFSSDIYDGYSTTTGFITNTLTPDIISGAPRFDGDSLLGGVRIRPQSDLGGLPVITVEGFQFTEYFGYSVAAADLNNDGFDELIVGAPMYSSNNLHELGRVYVYENTGGDLNMTAIILDGSSTPMARFGTSVVSIGDINGDNYEDIAVGAPYEANAGTNHTGAVHIYYGTTSEMGLISRIADQVIRARSIADVVPDVAPLRTFGFSLSSGVDVDGNLYNDLFIGAYESRAAVLIRSLSVAFVTVDLSTNVDTISVATNGSTFVLSVCASYNGRGLEGRSLNASVSVFEIESNRAQRLYFQGDQDRTEMDFYFSSTDTMTCVDVDVFVRAIEDFTTIQDLLAPLQVGVDFPPIDRPAPTYNGGDPDTLIDYRTIPVLIAGGNTTASVVPTVNCSLDANMDEVCRPDLTVTLLNMTYVDNQDNAVPGNRAIAGLADTLRVDLSYTNIGRDPAIESSVLSFTFPERFAFVQAIPSSDSDPVTCLREGTTLDYNCGLQNYIPQNEVNLLTLVWRLSGTQIVGNEEDEMGTVSISVTSTRHVETDTTNNDFTVDIVYAAEADLDISRFSFIQNPATYKGVPPVSLMPTVGEIGAPVQFSLRATNNGPSNALNVTLDIFIPTNDTANSFYLYLFNVTAAGSVAMSCDNSSINPENLQPAVSGTRRNRRSTRMPRQAPETDPVPQVSPSTVVRNCSTAAGRASYCSRIRCSIANFARFVDTTITISAALDERFFQFQTVGFVFVGYATISSRESFIQDDNITNNQRSTPPYQVVRFVEPEDTNFPIWIPIVCGILAIIIIVGLFVLLYFVGFFRRKKRQDEQDKDAEGDFVPPGPVERPEGKPEDDTDEKIADDEIGNTDDLQDSETDEKPEMNPEETSL